MFYLHIFNLVAMHFHHINKFFTAIKRTPLQSLKIKFGIIALDERFRQGFSMFLSTILANADFNPAEVQSMIDMIASLPPTEVLYLTYSESLNNSFSSLCSSELNSFFTALENNSSYQDIVKKFDLELLPDRKETVLCPLVLEFVPISSIQDRRRLLRVFRIVTPEWVDPEVTPPEVVVGDHPCLNVYSAQEILAVQRTIDRFVSGAYYGGTVKCDYRSDSDSSFTSLLDKCINQNQKHFLVLNTSPVYYDPNNNDDGLNSFSRASGYPLSFSDSDALSLSLPSSSFQPFNSSRIASSSLPVLPFDRSGERIYCEFTGEFRSLP